MEELAKPIIGLHSHNNNKLPHRLLISLCLLLILGTAASAGRDYKVGGRRAVKDVESNQEVQELGRYCVRRYNEDLRPASASAAPPLSFSEVVEAETQVVSGIKYFLKISASESGGSRNSRRHYYDAVVVVKPWAAESKVLLHFAPSSPSRTDIDMV